MLRAALSYARGHCPVFPLSRRTKGPLTRHGFKDATTDAATIDQWWRRWPDANIGLACTWFFAVDIDPRNDGHRTWAALTKGRSMPHTWESRTGSGGSHIFFRHDSRLDSVPLGKWRDGIDIKGGSRGYVVAPPSVHPTTGARYTWLARPRGTELAPAPGWLVELIVTDKRPPPSPPPVDPSRYRGVNRFDQASRYAQRFDPAISGQNGHAHTFWVCQRLVRGFALTDDEAYAILVDWNTRNEPPWSERELRRKIREARRHGSLGEGVLLR